MTWMAGEPQPIPGAWIDSFESGNSITIDDNIGSGWYLIHQGDQRLEWRG